MGHQAGGQAHRQNKGRRNGKAFSGKEGRCSFSGRSIRAADVSREHPVFRSAVMLENARIGYLPIFLSVYKRVLSIRVTIRYVLGKSMSSSGKTFCRKGVAQRKNDVFSVEREHASCFSFEETSVPLASAQ